MAPSKKGSSSSGKGKSQKQAPIPKPGTYGQEVLDELLSFSPGRSFDLAANILDPQEGVHTYAQWIQRNLAHVFFTPFGPHQQWLLDQVETTPHGLRCFMAAPRGSGKSALVMLGLPLAMIALGTHRFVVIVGNTQEEAEARLSAIRAELDRNHELVDVHPRLRYVMNRGSIRKHRVDTRREIELEGGRILALGAGAKVRGVVRHTTDGELMRPDVILGDDLDDPEQARSKLRTDRLEEWVFADLAGMGSVAKGLSIILIGTTIAADAMATRAMNHKGRFKTWTIERFPALYKNEKGQERPMWPEGLPFPYLRRLTDPASEEYVGDRTFSREYLLDPKDVTGALWNESLIAECYHEGGVPEMEQLIVSVDPSWGASSQADECGIIVAGRGTDKICYILEDRSIRARPLDWAETVSSAFHDWAAARIVIEYAFGHEDVKMVMQQVAPTLPLSMIRAEKDKTTRFEPVRVLYEQHKVKHAGFFPTLEEQMLEWVQGESHFSPDRVDAMVHAVRFLMLGAASQPAVISPAPDLQLPEMGPRVRLIDGPRRSGVYY